MPRASVRRNRLWGLLPERGAFALQQNDLIFTGDEDGAAPSAQPVDIVQLAGAAYGTLAVGTPSAAWLTVTRLTNTRVSVSVDQTGLAADVYTATCLLTGSNADAPVELRVTFTVAVVVVDPHMVLSATTKSFSMVVGGSAAAQTVTISSADPGSPIATPTRGSITGTGAAYVASAVITGTGPWTLTITPTAVGGTPGVTTADIPVESSTADNTPLVVTCTFTITAAQTALLVIDRTTDDFAPVTVGGSNPADLVVGVRSDTPVPLAGPQVGTITYSGDHSGWCSAVLSGTALTASANITGIGTPGFSKAFIPVTDANSPTGAVWQVVLNMGGTAAQPSLAVSPSGISRNVIHGQNAATATLTITNVASGTGGLAGLGTVTTEFVTPPAWASASYASATGLCTLTFATSALSDGTYPATLRVSATGDPTGTIDVPVQVIVTTPSGSYPNPRVVIPTWATFNNATNLLEDEPFATPALGGFS